MILVSTPKLTWRNHRLQNWLRRVCMLQHFLCSSKLLMNVIFFLSVKLHETLFKNNITFVIRYIVSIHLGLRIHCCNGITKILWWIHMWKTLLGPTARTPFESYARQFGAATGPNNVFCFAHWLTNRSARLCS